MRHCCGPKNFVNKITFFDQTCPRIVQMSVLMFRTLCSLSGSVQLFLHGVLWSNWDCSLVNLVLKYFVIPQFLKTIHFTLNKCMPTVGYTRCPILNITNGEFGHDVVNRIDLCTRGAVTGITPSLELDMLAFSYVL